MSTSPMFLVIVVENISIMSEEVKPECHMKQQELEANKYPEYLRHSAGDQGIILKIMRITLIIYCMLT